MKHEYSILIDTLSSNGWQVRRFSIAKPLPERIKSRYDWLPAEIREVIEETDLIVSASQKSWFVTRSELAGTNGTAFLWNQWEADSLLTAEGDSKWQREIQDFWNQHFTLLMSVKIGYAFFALSKDDQCIVRGEEPEFENTTKIANSYSEFLRMVASDNEEISRWL